MIVYRVTDFIEWALTHVKPATIPSGAVLPLPIAECGTEPWQYLFGSIRVMTTQATIEYYWENHYKKQKGMTRAKYDALTRDWDRNGYATDCQGLLDAWLTYECGVQTDSNADGNYRYWCADKGTISEITRPWVIGEAVFHMNAEGRMTHIGWICGFMPNGDPLIVEARGIAYGVVMTRLSGRDFTHRGLMTAKFDYNAAPEPQEDKPMEPIILKKTSPMMTGEGIRLMQHALNALGYTDDAGRQLDEDGKCGNCTMQAVTAFANAHTTLTSELIETEEPEPGVEIKPVAVYTVGRNNELTHVIFRTEDLPEG